MFYNEKIFEEKNLAPWDPPGVPRVPILGPNRGMFSKLNWPGPLGSGGHSHAIFSNGRFRGAQRSFGGDVVECGVKTVDTKPSSTPLVTWDLKWIRVMFGPPS